MAVVASFLMAFEVKVCVILYMDFNFISFLLELTAYANKDL